MKRLNIGSMGKLRQKWHAVVDRGNACADTRARKNREHEVECLGTWRIRRVGERDGRHGGKRPR